MKKILAASVIAYGLLSVSAVAASAASLDSLPETDGVMALSDKEELQDELADAYAVQDVCYSWEFRSTGYQGGTESRGSNFGTETDTREDRRCDDYVHMEMVANYTSPSSESNDDGSIYLYSSFPEITNDDDGKLGVSDGDIVGDNEDEAIFIAAGHLPRLVADKGLAPYLPLDVNTSVAVPSTDEIKDNAGSDVLRQNMGWVIFFSVVILAAIIGVIYVIVMQPSRKTNQPSPYDYYGQTKGRH